MYRGEIGPRDISRTINLHGRRFNLYLIIWLLFLDYFLTYFLLMSIFPPPAQVVQNRKI